MTVVVEEDHPVPPAAHSEEEGKAPQASIKAVEAEALEEASSEKDRQERRIGGSVAEDEPEGEERTSAAAAASEDKEPKEEEESVEGRFFIKQKLCFLGLGDVSLKFEFEFEIMLIHILKRKLKSNIFIKIIALSQYSV